MKEKGLDKVLTVCPFCGGGCGIHLLTEGDKIVGVEPHKLHPVNEGELCVKGYFGYDYVNDSRRLTTPLIKRDGHFVEATWDDALDYVATRLKTIKKESGPDSFALFASARCTNEDNYAAQKFVRTVMGTNNIDHCARL